jgi:hypothetical protein
MHKFSKAMIYVSFATILRGDYLHYFCLIILIFENLVAVEFVS